MIWKTSYDKCQMLASERVRTPRQNYYRLSRNGRAQLSYVLQEGWILLAVIRRRMS